MDHNPLAKRYKTILDLDYALLTKEGKLERDLELYDQYSKGSLFGFNLNPAIFNVIKKKADENKCTCSEMLQTILEGLYPEEISNELKSDSEFLHTNLVTTNEYAEIHGTIRESIKQFLNANPDRIPGALKLGRDWILPADSPYPSDKRKKV